MLYPPYYVIFDICLWNILFLAIYYCLVDIRGNHLPINYKTPRIFRSFVILFIVFGVFGFHTGDFNHYYQIVESVYKTNAPSHLEAVYIWFIGVVHGNYYLWRLIVWGMAFFFFYESIKKLHVDNYFSLLFFCGMLLPTVVEGRYFLGLTIFFWGFILLSNRSILTKALGVLLIVSSIFFHKSVLVLVLLIPFSYIKINRVRILLLIVLFPIVLSVFNELVVNILYALSISPEGDLGSIDGYLLEEETTKSIGTKILLVFRYLAFVSLIVWALWIDNKNNSMQKGIRARLKTFSFCIIYVSVLIYFSILGSPTMFNRFFIMAPYPLVLTIYNTIDEKDINKRFLRLFTIFCLVWQNAYMLLQMYYFSFN